MQPCCCHPTPVAQSRQTKMDKFRLLFNFDVFCLRKSQYAFRRILATSACCRLRRRSQRRCLRMPPRHAEARSMRRTRTFNLWLEVRTTAEVTALRLSTAATALIVVQLASSKRKRTHTGGERRRRTTRMTTK